MKNLWRRIRAALGMGLTWAVAGIVVGGVMARLPGFDTDVPLPFLFAQLGFAAGIVFSGILMAVAGRSGLKRISLWRFAVLGAASGLLLSGFFVAGAALRGASPWGEFLLFGPALGVAGAAFAAGSLALARRAERRELTGGSGDPAPAGLTGDEPRRRVERGS